MTDPAPITLLPGTSGFPTSQADCDRCFASEEACWRYLVVLRWPDGVPRHPVTGERPRVFKPSRRLWRFPDGYELSATAGTVLERSRVPLRTAFWAAFQMTTVPEGLSALQFAAKFDLRYETAFHTLHRMRAALVDPDRRHLTGVVEVGLASIGSRRTGGSAGAGSAGMPLIGAVERITGQDHRVHSGRLRLRALPRINRQTIAQFLADHVAPGAIVHTADDRVVVVCQSSGYRVVRVASVRDVTLIQHMLAQLQAWIQGTHHGAVQARHLQAYLNEFSFRREHRFAPHAAFRTALGIGIWVPAPTYSEIYHAGEPTGWIHANPPGNAVPVAGEPTG